MKLDKFKNYYLGVYKDGYRKVIQGEEKDPLYLLLTNQYSSTKIYKIHEEIIKKSETEEQILAFYDTLSESRRKLFFIEYWKELIWH